MEGLGVAASVIAVVDFSAKIAVQCYQYAQKVDKAKDDIDRMQKEIGNLRGIAESVQRLLQGPNVDNIETSSQLYAAVEETVNQLKELEERIRPKKSQRAMSKFGFRALKWPFESKEIEEIVQDLRNCGQNINSALQVDQTVEIIATGASVRRTEQLVDAVYEKQMWSQLPVADGACFGSNVEDFELTCLRDTRVGLLQRIQDWVQDPNAERVFWLNGMAGTGKSTIARTVAELLDGEKTLGASFFFQSGEADRSSLSKFFSTIAYDLVKKVPTCRSAVKAALDRDADFLNRAPGKQLKDLIIEPLIQTQNLRPGHSIVFIVDALDECEREREIELLIELFTNHQVMRVPQLKVFITSRPEISNRLGFAQASSESYRPMILHDLPKREIDNDISVFLSHRLSKIRDRWNHLSTSDEDRLPSQWPGQKRTQQLVEITVPLFIFAATVCRFIEDTKFGGPEILLQYVLDNGKPEENSEIKSTYLPILNRLVAGMDGEACCKVYNRFRLVVGSIVMLKTPQSPQTLSRLLDVPSVYVNSHLQTLHSVLNVPSSPDSPVRILHLSFKDFLVDEKNQEANPFWIDEKAAHANIASRALRLLGKKLKQNICSLSSWTTERKSIEAETIHTHLPPEARYSCSYWVHHIQQAGNLLVDDGLVHEFLQAHLLHWLEGLSLMGEAYESISHIRALRALADGPNGKDLSALLDDAVSFVLSNVSVLDSTPLQLYSSSLLFAPMKSHIRNKFESTVPNWITLHPVTAYDWGQCLQTLDAPRSASLMSVSFSHDSKFVVSAAWHFFICIWSVDTGQCTWILEGHKGGVQSAVFSHDSTRILSASNDHTIRVWSVDTGECIKVIEGHNTVNQAIYSFNSLFIASASDDKTVKVWQAETGEIIREFGGHTQGVLSVAFSHDTKLIASASRNTLNIWNFDQGSCVHSIPLNQESMDLASVAFSHDSAILACSSADNIIRIFKTDSGECVQNLRHHYHAKSAVFSSDSSLLASSVELQALIWRWETGECVQVLTGHGSLVRSISFSHDSELAASSSDDGTVRIWRVDASKNTHHILSNEYANRRGVEHTVVFSPDSTVIATSMLSGTRIWDSATGECGKSFAQSFCAFSSDSSLLLLRSSEPHVIQIFRVDTGAHLQTFHGHTSHIKLAVFSNDTNMVASASKDETIRIWLTTTGQCIHVLRIQAQVEARNIEFTFVVFSPNSQLILARAGLVNSLWRTSDGVCLRTWEVDHVYPSNVAFSPDSALIAFFGAQCALEVWHCDIGKRLHSLVIPEAFGESCAFSSDSKFIASSSSPHSAWKQEIHIWCIETGECLCTRSGCGQLIGFTSNDTCLATSKGIVALSNFPPARLNSKPVSSFFSGYGISSDRTYITWNGDNFLRLPAEYRPIGMAVTESTVVLGCIDGQVLILRFAAMLPKMEHKSPTPTIQT